MVRLTDEVTLAQRHLLYVFKGDRQYALLLLYQLSYAELLQRPDSNRRLEVAHIYGTLAPKPPKGG